MKIIKFLSNLYRRINEELSEVYGEPAQITAEEVNILQFFRAFFPPQKR